MKCHCRSGKEGEVDHEFVDGSCNARTEYCAGRTCLWKNEYDLERYEELRDIAAQMVAINTDIPVEIVKCIFVMRMAIRHRRWTPGLLFFKMEKFCLCMRKWNMGIAGRLV